jgi:HEPN domain-containing protein
LQRLLSYLELRFLLDKWSAQGIPAHRIVRGSAGSHLVLHGSDLPQIGSLEQVIQKIKHLTDLESSDELKQATGIIELQQRIQKYLDEERTALLKKRCDAMIGEILKSAKEIYQTVAAVYPEDPDSAKLKQEFNQGVEFSEWWGKRWQKIQADVNNRFKEGNEISIQNRQKFCERYGELVKEKMNALPSRQLDKRQEIFDSVSNPVFDSVKANIDWRESLYTDVRKMIKDLAHNLALELQQEALDLIKELEAQLWHSEEIKPRLLAVSDDIYVSLLEHSLNTLFLRFARPVSELLIRGAVSSETRQAIREKIGNDIEILDNYYSGGEPALERLKQYANHGVKLLVDENKRKQVLGASAKVVEVIVGTNPFANIAFKAIKAVANDIELPKANKQDEVIEEVESDIRVLEHYLIYGIFEASGFSAFCQQELENLRDSFMEKGSTWSGVTHGEWQRGNPELLKELPASLQSFQFDTEVSDGLKQLRLALDVVHSV